MPAAGIKNQITYLSKITPAFSLYSCSKP